MYATGTGVPRDAGQGTREREATAGSNQGAKGCFDDVPGG
jgi:hypothetical protein